MIGSNILLEKRNFRSENEVDDALSLISDAVDQVKSELGSPLSKQSQIESKMSSLGHCMITLNAISSDSTKLCSQIMHTSQLAEAVSAKVRRLDLARSRASECQQRVHDLIDLQLCSQGVISAISAEDYEKAAGHISRFLAMDQVLLEKTADDVQGSITSVSDAVFTLESATEKMKELVRMRFDEAVHKDDLASVERFFKIFPLLNQKEMGIEKFTNYICSKLSVKAKKELSNTQEIAKTENRLPIAYADAITTLLENFARALEVNAPIIESYYGAGHLMNMISILQRQCDLEIQNLVLEFRKYRQISRRVQQVNESQTKLINSGVGSSIQSLGHSRKSFGGSVDKLNAKDIDIIIAEITVMHSRSELYFRFIRRKVMADIEKSFLNEEEAKLALEQLDNLLQKSNLRRQMQELLAIYLLFERYFMEESVLKAISLDTHEVGMHCSTMVDDLFFILRKSIRRSLTTQSVNGTCAVINNAVACLDSDFINALKTPLKNGYPSGYIDLAQAYNALQSSLQQGKLQSSDTEKARNKFLVALNNADVSTEYVNTLWETVHKEVSQMLPVMSKVELQMINSCLDDLKAVRDTLKTCVDFGMQQLHSSAIKPRLNPWIDRFLDYNHCLTEEELAVYEASETFIQFLILQVDELLKSFKSSLTAHNYDTMVGVITTEITTRLEHAIKKSAFNRMGGLVLDQEVRALTTYLIGSTSWSVRDKMTRITQIATLLNLEKISELDDYLNPKCNDAPSWYLTSNEMRQILTLRTDFRMEDIKRIQF